MFYFTLIDFAFIWYQDSASSHVESDWSVQCLESMEIPCLSVTPRETSQREHWWIRSRSSLEVRVTQLWGRYTSWERDQSTHQTTQDGKPYLLT